MIDRPCLNPGDAVVWENRVFHAAERNVSDRVRKAIMIQYGFQWLKPGDHMSYCEEMLSTCDPITRQLLSNGDFNPDGSITKQQGSASLSAWCAANGIEYVPAQRAAVR